MNFDNARSLAQQISTSVNLVHSQVDALKEALIIGRPIDADDITHLAGKIDSLHALLGTADTALGRLYHNLARLSGDEARIGPITTLSGGTPKD